MTSAIAFRTLTPSAPRSFAFINPMMPTLVERGHVDEPGALALRRERVPTATQSRPLSKKIRSTRAEQVFPKTRGALKSEG
jgi:hypothetical protein